MAHDIEVKRGDVVRYHPVIGRPDYIRVRIVEEPWELASGGWICKARGLDDDRIYRPSVRALSSDGADDVTCTACGDRGGHTTAQHMATTRAAR